MAVDASLGEILTLFFSQLAAGLPLLIVYIGGIIFTLVLWNRQPRASLLAMLGLALMLVTSLLGTCLFSWAIQTELGDFGKGPLLSVLGIGRSLFTAAGLSLVLAAVFVGRDRPQRPAIPHREELPSVRPVPPGPSHHVTPDRPPGA
jgi:hypothetical protein